MNLTKMKYEMTIAWSEEDDCYLVGFPEFPGQKWRTHGDTYETAVNNGVEALESLMLAVLSHIRCRYSQISVVIRRIMSQNT